MASQTVSSVARTGSTAVWRRKRGEMPVGQQRLARHARRRRPARTRSGVATASAQSRLVISPRLVTAAARLWRCSCAVAVGAHGGIGRDPPGQHQARQHRIELAGAGILERCRGGAGRARLERARPWTSRQVRIGDNRTAATAERGLALPIAQNRPPADSRSRSAAVGGYAGASVPSRSRRRALLAARDMPTAGATIAGRAKRSTRTQMSFAASGPDRARRPRRCSLLILFELAQILGEGGPKLFALAAAQPRLRGGPGHPARRLALGAAAVRARRQRRLHPAVRPRSPGPARTAATCRGWPRRWCRC